MMPVSATVPDLTVQYNWRAYGPKEQQLIGLFTETDYLKDQGIAFIEPATFVWNGCFTGKWWPSLKDMDSDGSVGLDECLTLEEAKQLCIDTLSGRS